VTVLSSENTVKPSSTSDVFADLDQRLARKRPRSTLPSAPWVELLGFLLIIALCVSGQL
jgi:hypothetical protein